MDLSAIVAKLKEVNRMEVSRQTNIPYQTLCNIVAGRTKNPLSATVDKLREHFGAKQ